MSAANGPSHFPQRISGGGRILQPALRIVLLYILFSVVWFFLVERLLAGLMRGPSALATWTALKQWGFVGLTSLVLFVSLRRSLSRLRASEQRWKLLFDAAPDAYYLHDLTGTFVDGNRAAEALTGYAKQELIGKSVLKLDLLVPDDVAKAAEFLERNRQGKGSGPTSYTLKKKDGTLAAVEVRTLPVQVQDQLLVLGIARDVTERKRAEEALRLSEQRFRLGMLNSPIGMAIVAPDGRWLEVNPAFCKIVGYSADELLATNFQSITHPDDLDADLERLEALLSGRAQTSQADKRYIHKEGYAVWIQLNVSLILSANNTPCYFVAQIQDITERKIAQERLRQSEARFSAVFRASPTAIGISEFPEGPFIEVNDTFLATFGFAREEVIGRTSAELGIWWSRDERSGLIETLRERGRAQQREARFRRKSGELGDLLISAELMVVDGKEFLLGMLLDITARKRLEAQLLQAQKMEAVGQLAGGVAHDFNNILAAQLLQLQLIEQRKDLDPEITMALQDLEKGIERAAGLTRQLLLFSRRQVMQIKRIDLDELITGLMKMLQRLLGEHIVMSFSQSSKPVWVDADAGMIEQVVMNLCVNARDAMPSGGALIIGTERVWLDANTPGLAEEARAGSFVCVTVRDTGAGMDDSTLKRIFEPFFTTKEPGKGTGLGLATVHGIVKQHQGWIEVQSAPSCGATFRVFLPAKDAPPNSGSASAQPSILGGVETILVVEDDEPLRQLVRRTLVLFGYKVLEAAGPAEALELWQREQPVHLIFTDMVMPGGLTGLELTDRIRHIQPSVKVLLASGYSSDLPLETGNLPSGVRFLAKPYTPSALAVAVRQSLDDPAGP